MQGNTWFYLDPANAQVGPLTWPQLEQKFHEGVVQPTTLIWGPHLSSWVPASSVFAPPPPPLAVPPPSAPTPSAPAFSAGAGAPSFPTFGTNLPEPPEAHTSRLLGIWALVTCLLCLPICLILASIAISKSNRAKEVAKASPGSFRAPSSAGRTMGVTAIVVSVGLTLASVLFALALPAFLAQPARETAKMKVVQSMVAEVASESVRIADQLRDKNNAVPRPEAVIEQVLALPTFQYPNEKNPYGGTAPPFIAGAEPTEVGQVALKGGYSPGSDGKPAPTITVRGQYRSEGKLKVFEKTVSID